MSWFDRAKDVINENIEEAKENAADTVEEMRIENERNKERRKLFKATSKSQYVEADMVNNFWRLTSNRNEIYDLSDLLSYELIQDGDTITSGGLGVGRAVVGTIIAGPIGAVLGGLTKKKKTSSTTDNLQIRISNSATKKSIIYITLLNKKTKHKSRSYRQAIESAQKSLDILDLISSKAEKINNVPPVENNEDNNLTKIRQLKELLDDGIITQEEFEKKKRILLN